MKESETGGKAGCRVPIDELEMRRWRGDVFTRKERIERGGLKKGLLRVCQAIQCQTSIPQPVRCLRLCG